MIIKKLASAGSLESSDALITIEPNDTNDINITINSPFIRQFGKQIKNTAFKTLENYGVNSCSVVIQDQGAIDQVIVARLITALERASGEKII